MLIIWKLCNSYTMYVCIHMYIHFMHMCIITYPLIISMTHMYTYTGSPRPGRHRRQRVSRAQDHRARNGFTEHSFNLPLRPTRCGGVVCGGESL